MYYLFIRGFKEKEITSILQFIHNLWILYYESLVRRMKDILDLKDMENYMLI